MLMNLLRDQVLIRPEYFTLSLRVNETYYGIRF